MPVRAIRMVRFFFIFLVGLEFYWKIGANYYGEALAYFQEINSPESEISLDLYSDDAGSPRRCANQRPSQRNDERVVFLVEKVPRKKLDAVVSVGSSNSGI